MIDKVYRFIYIGSLSIMGLFLITVIMGRMFFDDYRNSGAMEKLLGILVLITPFAPIGTLFGTLKENQSTRKKMTIILYTGLSVLFLLFFIWGTLIASTFA